MNELYEFLKLSQADIIYGNRKMYFDDGEWVVMERKYVGSRWFHVDSFIDSIPTGLTEAVGCLAG